MVMDAVKVELWWRLADAFLTKSLGWTCHFRFILR